MNLREAKTIAEKICGKLAPHCQRIEIAGSIRRRKAEVGDIEIVCIPAVMYGGLFKDIATADPGFCRVVNQWPAVKGSPIGKYTQRILPEGIKLDLFMATPENWGLIFAIRTGSKNFTHRKLATRWVQLGYKSVEGMLQRDGRIFPVKEELDLFDLLGMDWVDPGNRELP